MSKGGNLPVKKSLRLTEEEGRFLQQQSERSGLNESEYMRRLLDAAAGRAELPVPKEKFLAIKELAQEINYIGHNINQIVRNVNAHFYSEEEKERLFRLMDKVRGLLEERFR